MTVACLTHVHDAPEGVEPPVAAHAHVPEVAVLSGPRVHHPAPVVGLLVPQPVAVHHVAGLALGHAVALRHVVTVVRHLVHLAAEVIPLVDPHPELSPVLEAVKSRETGVSKRTRDDNGNTTIMG